MHDFDPVLSSILNRVGEEVERARKLHKPMHSPHEAYAVILEEVDEYWDEVKKQQYSRDRARKELLQVAAMAIRAICDLG